jgi:hypothetical protein
MFASRVRDFDLSPCGIDENVKNLTRFYGTYVVAEYDPPFVHGRCHSTTVQYCKGEIHRGNKSTNPDGSFAFFKHTTHLTTVRILVTAILLINVTTLTLIYVIKEEKSRLRRLLIDHMFDANIRTLFVIENRFIQKIKIYAKSIKNELPRLAFFVGKRVTYIRLNMWSWTWIIRIVLKNNLLWIMIFFYNT